LAVAADFLVSRASPHGTFMSLAYTQADTPLLAMAAITGGWGIVAVLYAVPVTANLIALPSRRRTC
jgi:apolipoprotein N-acyltransferase